MKEFLKFIGHILDWIGITLIWVIYLLLSWWILFGGDISIELNNPFK